MEIEARVFLRPGDLKGLSDMAFVDIDGFIRSQLLNLVIAVIFGLGVGLIEDVPIDLVPDALIFGLAVAMVIQEAALVQRTGVLGGRYEKEMREYTERMLSFFDSKTFWLFGILTIFFVLGMIPLVLSERELDAISVARIFCVAVIITLGVDPILGTLPKKDGTATIGAPGDLCIGFPLRPEWLSGPGDSTQLLPWVILSGHLLLHCPNLPSPFHQMGIHQEPVLWHGRWLGRVRPLHRNPAADNPTA